MLALCCRLSPSLGSPPLSTAPYHTDELGPMVTSPMTEALGATKATWLSTGRRPL